MTILLDTSPPIEGAENEKIQSLKKLAEYSSKIFNTYERDDGKRNDLF